MNCPADICAIWEILLAGLGEEAVPRRRGGFCQTIRPNQMGLSLNIGKARAFSREYMCATMKLALGCHGP
jgi:hypothetical protein